MQQEVITFTVHGVPAPKGSTKAFRRPGMKYPVITNDNPHTAPWAALIAHEAMKHRPAMGPWTGAITLAVAFYLPRPKSLPKSVVHHVKKPDLDKLLRALKDALKGILYVDDSQVVHVEDLRKLYVSASISPGVSVTVRRIA